MSYSPCRQGTGKGVALTAMGRLAYHSDRQACSALVTATIAHSGNMVCCLAHWSVLKYTSCDLLNFGTVLGGMQSLQCASPLHVEVDVC